MFTLTTPTALFLQIPSLLENSKIIYFTNHTTTKEKKGPTDVKFHTEGIIFLNIIGYDEIELRLNRRKLYYLKLKFYCALSKALLMLQFVQI